MITLLIGHRGTGKSALLSRLKGYAEERRLPLRCLDLDAEIVALERISIADIFARRGEAGFRTVERDHLVRIVAADPERRGDTFVALGAGFEGPIPPGVRCIWIRRDDDAQGRIFVDRPRLDPKLDPIDEYRRRFRVREARFREWADDIITVPAGFDRPSPRERDLLFDELTKVGGCQTLLPEHFRSAAAWKAFLKSRLRRGVAFLEARDDLLSIDALEAALEQVPASRLIYSFRRARPPFVPSKLEERTWDWPLELGECPHGTPSIVSLHERRDGETVTAAAARLEAAAPRSALVKLAPMVADFQELGEGHRWAEEDPKRRSFLPRSEDGRWQWYRAQFRGPIAFFREGEGSSPDQPSLLDWLRVRPELPHFAAVLGDPVAHSRTPAEQEAFFAARLAPVHAIRVTGGEWETGALEALRRLGLRWAAVTSPLKEPAFETAVLRTDEATRLHAVNTLRYRDSQGWEGHLTDPVGLRALLASADLGAGDRGETVVWGGGALLPMLKEALPDAAYYGARTGAPRENSRAVTAPETLVWAGSVPRVAPPASWTPRLVVDLGYRADSPARRFALRTGARYVDGTAMFLAQAAAQREWWAE